MKWLKRIGLFFVLILASWLVYAQVGMKYRTSDSKARQQFKDAGVELFLETIDVNGSKLHYAKTGSDTLPTLFFVHGSPGSWTKFGKYLQDKDLLKKFRIVSVDRPGYGFSRFGNTKHLAEQASIITVLLKRIDNGKPIYAIGRSYGGPMIAKLAIDNPGLFSGLVFIASALDPAAEKKENWRPLLYKSPLKYFVPGAWRVSNEELWYLKKELIPLAKGLSSITCPVIILHGDKDGLVPVSNAQYAKKMLVNARSVSVSIIPGANHFLSDNHYELVRQILFELY